MITPIGRADRRRSFLRGIVIRSVTIVTLTAIAAVIGLFVFADHQDLVLKSALAAGGLLVALTLLNRFASYLYDSDEPSARRPQRGVAPEWPAELHEIEARVSLAQVSAFDHQTRLRPLLRELATQRLDASHHVDVVRQPDEAQRLLGAELWNEVQQAPPSRDLRDAPGPSHATIVRLVEMIESI